MYLYKIRGSDSKKVKMLHESNGVDEKGNWVYVERKIYYIQVENFEIASKKARKILDNVDSVTEVRGKFINV